MKMDDNGKSGHTWTEEYEAKVIKILQAINGNEAMKKNRQFYYIKNSFKLTEFDGVTKVCRNRDNKIMTSKTHAWNIIRDVHTTCGHRGEKHTYKLVSEHYANIPMILIKHFLEQCEYCIERTRKRCNSGNAFWPVVSTDFQKDWYDSFSVTEEHNANKMGNFDNENYIPEKNDVSIY